jgi:hypothetical protein
MDSMQSPSSSLSPSVSHPQSQSTSHLHSTAPISSSSSTTLTYDEGNDEHGQLVYHLGTAVDRGGSLYWSFR